MIFKYATKSPSQTKRMGKFWAKKILKKRPSKKAILIGLEGNLGGGKTTFLQGFAKGLGIKEKILSPTFVIIKRFKIKDLRLKFQNFYHIDCCRIKKPKELLGLGFKKNVSDPQNIIAVEWADRIKKIMPLKTIWIKFEFVDEKRRKIMVKQII